MSANSSGYRVGIAAIEKIVQPSELLAADRPLCLATEGGNTDGDRGKKQLSTELEYLRWGF